MKVTICQTQPWLDFAKHLNQQPTSCSFMKPNGSLGFLKYLKQAILWLGFFSNTQKWPILWFCFLKKVPRTGSSFKIQRTAQHWKLWSFCLCAAECWVLVHSGYLCAAILKGRDAMLEEETKPWACTSLLFFLVEISPFFDKEIRKIMFCKCEFD